MKNVNLIEMLRGCSKRNGTTFRQSNPDGQPTVNRQSRLMSHRGYLRNLAMIFAILVLSVANIGMAWGADATINFTGSGVSTYFTETKSNSSNIVTSENQDSPGGDYSGKALKVEMKKNRSLEYTLVTKSSYENISNIAFNFGTGSSARDNIKLGVDISSKADFSSDVTTLMDYSSTWKASYNSYSGGDPGNSKMYGVSKSVSSKTGYVRFRITNTSAGKTAYLGTITITTGGGGGGGGGDCYSDLAYSGGASMPTGWTIVSASSPTPQIYSNTIAMQKSGTYAYSSGAPTRGMYFDADQNATISITSFCQNSRAFCLVEKNGGSYSIIQTWDGEETLTASIVSGRTYYLTSKSGSSDNAKCNITAMSFSDCASSCTARTFKSGEKIYFKDQESNFDFDALWKVSSGQLYAYFWNDDESEKAWSDAAGTCVEGSWNAANAIYELTVPGSGKEYTHVLFTRGKSQDFTIDSEKTWDKTTNQEPCEGKNLFYVEKGKYADHIYYGHWGNFTPAGKTVYFDARIAPDTWTTAYLRIGHGSSNSAWGAMTKVAGTKCLYSQTTSKWASHTDFAIANKAGWTGSNAIDQPEKTYSNGSWSDSEHKMTMQTNYQQYAIENDIYICPKATSVLEHECQYYQVTNENSTTSSRIDENTTAMALPSYTVTYSGTNCTVAVVKYTNDAGSSTSAISSGDEVDPTRIIKVTVTPSTGYQFSAVEVTGVGTITAAAAGTPGVYYVTDNATISATCTAKTCTVTFDKESGSGGSNSVTATYGSAMPDITPPTRAGYDFAGYWDEDNGTGTQYYNADGTSKENWNKDVTATQTLYAKWNCITPDAPAAAKITATDGCAGSSGATFSADDSGKPSYVTWYWQTASDGTSTSYPVSSDYETASTAGSKTMYVRAKNTACDTWSTATSKSATVKTAATVSWSAHPTSATYGDGGKTFSVTTNYESGLAWTLENNTCGAALTGSGTSRTLSYTGVGSVDVKATVTGAGDSYCSSAFVSETLTVGAATPTATFNDGEYTIGGSALDLSTLWTSNSGGTVTYSVTDANGTGATVAGSSFTATTAGTASVRASQAANGNYSAITKDATITVNPAADVTAPTLSSSTPANGATGVAVSGNIVLTFSENVTIVDASKFTLTGGAGTLNTAGATVSGAAVTIPYSGLANSTNYTIAGAAGAVQDAAGNNNAALSSFSFTTVAAAPAGDCGEIIKSTFGGTKNTSSTPSTTTFNTTGEIGGTSTSAIIGDNGKLNSEGAYLILKLSTGTFLAGDTIKISSDKSGGVKFATGTVSTQTYTHIGTASTATSGGQPYYFVLAANADSIIVPRGSDKSDYNQNPKIAYVSVHRPCPECDATPSAPTATSNGATAATTQVVSWTDGSNDKWDVYVSTSSSTPAAGVTPTASGLTAKTYTFTGLMASTEYHWWVRSVCDASHKSAWVAGSSFTTSAAPTLYTVTFNSNGGSAVSPIEQASEGASITMPTPTKSGYSFQGWVIGGNTYAAGASYTPEANVTAYATWKADCAGGGGSGATLFSQNFNSATAVAYEDRAGSKLSITSSSSNSIVGNTAASQFTSITADKKGSTGIAINSASGGNSQSASGIFQAYYNNTGGYWSISKTSDFAATAPTAIKVSMKVWARVGSSSSAVMANFAVGDGFSDGLTNSSPGASSVHSGFGITNESTMKFCAYNTYGTKIYSSGLTQSSWMTLTWVINNTGSALTYDDPKSTETTVNNDCYDLWMGTTLVAHNIAATTAAKDLQNLYIGSPSGKNHEIRLDDISVVDLSPAGSGCLYVTYNGNGAEAGSISDATAYTAGTSVTVSSNTGASAFTKSGYHVGSWNTVANGSGTAYALGATFNISADVTLYAQWVADACSAPSAPTISGTSVRTVGQTITLNAACASGADASTTYTWFKGVDWATASAASPVQEALTAGEGGRIFNKASCVAGDEGTYWCEASNGDGCEAHNAAGFTVTVNDAAGDEHIYFYKDDNHYSDGVYSDPEGNTASSGDNKSLSSPWMICNGCKAGVDSVVAHGATYDGKGNHMNAYIKLPTGGNATTKNIKFALTAGYTGTLKMKIGGYENNPTVTLQPLNTSTGVLGDAISYSGTVSGVATTENNFGEITWNLTTPGGTYVLTVTTKTGYISQIDMTTSTSATFNVTYNGNDNTGGTVPTDATNYASGATVTAAANSGTLVKTNYTGAGWNTANNGTGTNYVPGSGTFKITANTTLYAHWTQLITLAPGTQGTGTNNAAVSWNGSVLRGFAAHTASGYALQGYYTEPSGGTKVLNADGSFAATDIDGFVTSGKWSNTGAAPTLYAQWEASSLLKWNLKVNVAETSITTLSKESAAPTVIAVANMGNLTNNGSLTITDNAKSALTSKIATTASATGADAGKYMSVQFVVAAGYQLKPSDIKVKVQPISHSQTTKLILEDNNSRSISYTSGSLSKGSTHTVTMTNSEEVAFTGTVTLKIYVYGTAESDGYRLGTPIEINGSVEETCTPPTFSGISYSATEYTVGASASAISVTGAENVDTYAWKQNDVNDRSGGTAATGTNNAVSYTPPTSAADTMYYWCEMTNGCTTVKTAAVGIMVRNATTDPTVTWSNVKLGATDDVTPNYGGGNYVLRATVNETSWPGTLAASMITAPAGITIHHVTTGKDGSDKKYIEFKFDVTTAFDRASNAKIDFNIALPEAGSYSAFNSVKSVSYEACTEGTGAAGQVAIKMGATASTSKSNPQNYWETAGAGRLMFNYGGNMGSSYNSEGYKTADSTFNYYAASTGQKWMFQTYIGGVNKVRVVFRAAGTIKSSKATITNFYYNTEYFASPGSNAVSFGEVSASKAGYSSGEDGYIEFTVPEMAANSYGAFVTGDGNMKVYGVVLYSENAGGGGSVETNPAWSGGLANDGSAEVNKTQSDANFTYTISTTTNTLGAITYSSSNPSCAAVDPVTGEVTITATGTEAQSAEITATLARSGCYKGATRTYTINVAGYSCSEPSGSVELTSGSATKCASESVTLTMTDFTEGADIQWYNGDSPISDGGGYTITTTATRSTLTTTAAGTYSAIANSSCDAKRTNSITIANMDMSEQKTVRKVSQWYVKNGRLTPDIALWQLGEGETFKSVAWSSSNGTGLDFRTDTETGIVYLEGKEPSANTSGADIPYTLTLTITDACGTDHELSGQTIKLTHQKNTDKHVLAFVVNGTAKGGFTEGITAAQTTSVGLYNAIAAQFDVQATNIYSTDDEQKLREYYSQYDILCITDYPNTQTKGVNSKSYVDAIGALIDIRPILTMEAFVSSLPNWKLKGVSGNPKSPSTRQYTMLLQCKDHEIFSGTKLTKVGEGLDALYRVTMVDKNQEEYKTLDANYGDGEHKANEGYQYGKKPALQGFTYTEEMSDNNMLPLGLIDDGAGNNLQVGIERQKEMEARMMVLGINSYAMERLDKDGQTIVINALKYLMKKSAEDISDCSVYFDGSDETDPTNWDNELNWGPSYASLPLPHQEVRILKECVVKDGVVARASGIKIIPRGRINHDTGDASGSLTIEPGGALIVDGKVRAAVAPNYFNATPTAPSNLVLQSNSSAQAALIFDNSEGETQATVQMWNPSYWETVEGKKKKYWSYVAVPIQEADIPNFFWHGFTYLYDETSGWIKKGDGTSLYPFQGIGASLQTGNMETFYGPLATTESQDITLTYTADKGQGMNLIGNSWTAPIQIANFEEDDFGDAAAEVWVFNTGNENDGTPGSGSSTTAGQWNTIPINAPSLPGYEGLKVIPAMQAFEVNTESETTLHLDYDRLVRAGRENLNEPMRAPRRSAAKQIEATMRVRVSGESTHTDVYLLKDARFSDGFDNGWDGHFLSGDDRSAQLYAISEEEGKLAFLAQPEIEGTQLGFAPSKHGNEYTFSFSYDGDEEYYLNDIKLKTSTLISEDATYSFTYGDGDTNRFYISRTPIDAPQTSTGVDNTGNGEVKARKFIYRDKMYIMINGRVYGVDGALVK